MSEQEKKPKSGLPHFETLSTDALEAMLQADAQQLDSLQDLDTVLYITQILERRARDGKQYTFDAEEKYKEFKQYYLPFDTDSEPLSSEPEETLNVPPHSLDSTPPHKMRKRRPRLLRSILIAAVVVSVIFAASLVASAAIGENIWSIVANWTDELFSFSREVANDKSASSSIVDKITDEIHIMQITQDDLPTWYPEGYHMGEIETAQLTYQTDVFIPFSSDTGGYYVIQITQYVDTKYMEATRFEKDAGEVDTIVHNDQIFYFFTNTGDNIVAWVKGNYIFSISGALSKEAITSMVLSIGSDTK